MPRITVAADALRIAGSQTVGLAVAEAAQILRSERGIQIQISTAGGSAGGISALGDGTADVAMSSRPVTAEERAEYPGATFTDIYLGEQVVALGVAHDVWEGGVHALNRDQVKSIYESKVTNWARFGGPDHKIAFFNYEEGRGTWELFAQWLYGDNRKAPAGKFPSVFNDTEARNTIEFTPGAMTLLSPLFVDGERSHALEIKAPDGKSVAPTPENVAAKSYPLTRPLLLIVNERPTQNARTLCDFLLSPRGQELLKKHGFYGADVLNKAKETKEGK